MFFGPQEICTDVEQYPEHVPDVAEHCMRRSGWHPPASQMTEPEALSQVTNFNIFWVVWKTDPLVRHLLMEVFDTYIYILRLTCGFQHDADAPLCGILIPLGLLGLEQVGPQPPTDGLAEGGGSLPRGVTASTFCRKCSSEHIWREIVTTRQVIPF